jgi:small-conductance mechanosensitive channel
VDPTILDRLIDRLPDNVWLQAGVVLAVVIAVAWLVDFVISRIVSRMARRTSTDLDDRLVAALHRPVFISVLLLGLWLILLRFEILPAYQLLLQRLLKTTALLVWTVFGWRASKIVLDAYSKLEARVQFVKPRTVPLLDNTMRILLVALVTYFLFLTWGVNIAAWMATAGIVGIAVGFAAKDTLANLFAGLFIMVDAPYEKGDFVVLGSGDRGMVTKIGLRSTRILTRDDIEITIPNAVIANEQIINETGGPGPKYRIRIPVGLAYGSDLDKVRNLLLEIASRNPEVCEDPEPRVRFRGFGDSELTHQLLCWVDEPVLRGRVTDALNTEIYRRFNEEGIDFPFPTRDLYIREMPTPGGKSP